MSKQVYFIKPIGMAGPIKIGCSRNPNLRLADYNRMSPILLELAATLPCGEFNKLERQLHTYFIGAHLHGEWFKATPLLLDVIHAATRGIYPHKMIELPEQCLSLHSRKPRTQRESA